MGRLSGFSYQKVTQKLNKLGFQFYRNAKGDHEIWFNPETKAKTTIPHHREIKEGTLKNILKQANIDIDIFLKI
ncbi:type II toxin-antitoxin system HicA family toxin [Geminocystis herdmanii]|uniref:type II toxin-antitoxin system HicA family toxin n=1 Tax=Geminocystis herdmanii TaxID=669359 RepID=UPI00034607F8|nr:type II toxin-antitoxin system HicA family toxin [Geminocystis herdmanii]